MATALAEIPSLILVGGLGSRLRPVLADRQKVVAEVGGRPFVSRLLHQLAAAGVSRAVLCTGYRGDQVAEALGSSHRGLSLTYSREPEPRGTAGALRQALPLIDAETVIVLNGDSYCEADLAAFAAWHLDRGAAGSLVLTHVPEASRFGRVRFDKGGAVMAFEEKLQAHGPGWINAGIYLISRRLIEEIPPERPVSIEREVFPLWAGRGLYAWPHGGRFLDIGTPESYAAAEEFFGGDRPP